MDLNSLRSKIDVIDENLVKLLNERIKVTKNISEYKQKTEGGHLYRPEREAALLDRVTKLNHEHGNGMIDDELIRFFFTQVMSATFYLGGQLNIAYLGPVASYTHLAAIKRYGGKVNFLPMGDISSIFYAVEKGEADFGVVPIENSTEGMVTHTLDRFVESPLSICSEVELKIKHCLLSNEDSLDKIKKVFTHPQSLGQCREWLQRHLPKAELVAEASNSKAAKIAASKKGAAAIASEVAAEEYGLDILKKNIQDSNDNVTRFIVIGNYKTVSTKKDKTSVVFSMKDEPGALDKMLTPFKAHKINLTKIESRPLKNKLWQYYFFVDLEGHQNEKNIAAALEEVKDNSQMFKILGSYPKAR